MAAAEYYNPGSSAANLAPPAPSRPQGHPPAGSDLPYPMSDAPPPYSLVADQRPHSQPPPQQRPPLPMNGPLSSGPSGPNGAFYAPEKDSYPPGAPGPQTWHQPPPAHGGSYGPYPQQQQHPQQQAPLQSGPYAQPSYQQGYYPGPPPAQQPPYGHHQRTSSTPAYPPGQAPQRPYSRSRSSSRDRRNRRHHHHHHHHDWPSSSHMALPPPGGQSRKKSNGVGTFLGAGGGAIIGDAIFPGLGTLGGAILGGIGGHEYGKDRGGKRPSTRPRDRAYSSSSYEDDRRGRRY